MINIWVFPASVKTLFWICYKASAKSTSYLSPYIKIPLDTFSQKGFQSISKHRTHFCILHKFSKHAHKCNTWTTKSDTCHKSPFRHTHFTRNWVWSAISPPGEYWQLLLFIAYSSYYIFSPAAIMLPALRNAWGAIICRLFLKNVSRRDVITQQP